MDILNRITLNPLAAVLAFALALLAPGLAAADQVVSPATLKDWIDSGRPHIVVDVRKEVLYQAAHVPGALSIPAEVLPYKLLPKDRDVVLYDNDLSGLTARNAAAGLKSVDAAHLFLLQGGLRAWEAAGYDANRPAGQFDATLDQVVSAEDLREAIRIGLPVRVLDLRDAKSFGQGTLPGAANVPLLKSPEQLKSLKSDNLGTMVTLPEGTTKRLKSEAGGEHSAPSGDAVAAALAQELAGAATQKGKKPSGIVVVIDESGVLARKVVPHLKRYGIDGALTVEGGFAGWQALQNPATTGAKSVIYHGGSSVPVRHPAGT